jgi:hypothetical protein
MGHPLSSRAWQCLSVVLFDAFLEAHESDDKESLKRSSSCTVYRAFKRIISEIDRDGSETVIPWERSSLPFFSVTEPSFAKVTL